MNLFSSERELDEYLTRAFGRTDTDEGCRRTEVEMGCKQQNITVSLDLTSRRFDPQKIERALADLGEGCTRRQVEAWPARTSSRPPRITASSCRRELRSNRD